MHNLVTLRREELWGPYIIVAPFSSVQCWVQAFKERAPSIPTVCLVGNSAERERLYSERLNSYNNQDAGSPVVIATYEAAMQDNHLADYGAFRCMTVEVGKRYNSHIGALLCSLRWIQRDDPSCCLLLNDSSFVEPATVWSALLFLHPELLGDYEWTDIMQNYVEVPRSVKSIAALAKIWKLLQAPSGKHQLSRREQLPTRADRRWAPTAL